MKNLHLLVWLTQLGISVAGPPVCAILLAVWLRNAHGWGSWIIWAGTAFGLYCGFQGLRDSLRAMDKLAKRHKAPEMPPPISFNEHD